MHHYRAFGDQELLFVLQRQWESFGLGLSPEDFTDSETIAPITRITGGNFRLVRRLLAQVERILGLAGGRQRPAVRHQRADGGHRRGGRDGARVACHRVRVTDCDHVRPPPSDQIHMLDGAPLTRVSGVVLAAGRRDRRVVTLAATWSSEVSAALSRIWWVALVALLACSQSSDGPALHASTTQPSVPEGTEVRLHDGTIGRQTWMLVALTTVEVTAPVDHLATVIQPGQLCVSIRLGDGAGGYCTPQPRPDEFGVSGGGSTGSGTDELFYVHGGTGSRVASVRIEWADGTSQSAPTYGAPGFPYRAFVILLPRGAEVSVSSRVRRAVALDSSGGEIGVLPRVPGCSTGCETPR